MSIAELTFGEKTVKKSDLYKEDTKLFRIGDININKIYIYIYILHIGYDVYMIYIGYDDDYKIVLLLIKLPQLSGYYRIFKNGETINFVCVNKKNIQKIQRNMEKT